jgi:hypothetical protein
MILSLPASRRPGIPGAIPQRRRVVIVGATEAGVCAAFHLGVQAMLLEQRGLASDADGVSRAEHQALGAAATPPAQAGAAKRWELPQLTAEETNAKASWTDLLAELGTVTRAETRLGVSVIAIDTIEHRIEVSTGESFVYDKLISTLRISDLRRLIVDEKPDRIYSLESWRYWLIDRDIELLDQSTQRFWGDPDCAAAGRRVAETVYRAMSAKYSSHRENRPAALFQPRIVSH